MSMPNLHRDYANSLLADLQLPAAATLPRREAIMEWLRDFLKGVRPDAGEEANNDVPNLLAINEHLLAHAISGAERPGLA